MKSPNLDLNEDCLNEQTKEKPVGDEVGETENEVPNAPEQLPDEEEDLGEEEPLPRASRNRRPPERYGNAYIPSTQFNMRKPQQNRKPTKRL